jgi:hypothetical protein
MLFEREIRHVAQRRDTAKETATRASMPIQTLEHWEEKARAAEAMAHAPARFAMLEIAQLYRQLAEQTRKLVGAREDP